MLPPLQVPYRTTQMGMILTKMRRVLTRTRPTWVRIARVWVRIGPVLTQTRVILIGNLDILTKKRENVIRIGRNVE